jgi:hypothetical protein
MFSRVALAASVVLGLVFSADGQGVNPRRGGPAPIQFVPVQLVGTVAGVKPGMIAVTTAAGETWALSIPPKVEVRVTGTAEPDVLSVGMYVRFIAPVDKRQSAVQGTVEKLTIFTPSQEEGRMPGVFHAGQEGDAGLLEAGGAAAPGPPAAADREPAAGAQQPANPPAAAAQRRSAAAADKPAEDVETFDVRGQLTSVRGRLLTVTARNSYFKPALRFELAEQPEISIDVSDYTLARSGDNVTANGALLGPQTMEAIDVSIQLVGTIGEPARGSARRAGQRNTQQRSGAGSERDAFEVAGQMEQDKPEQAQQPPPVEKPEKAEPDDQRGKQIAELLQASPEEVRGKPGVELGLGGAEPKKFTPCKQVSGKEILGKFGLPDSVLTVTGKLALGAGGQQQEIKWQLWAYGNVMFFVDEADTTRYMCVDAIKPQEEQKAAEPKP